MNTKKSKYSSYLKPNQSNSGKQSFASNILTRPRSSRADLSSKSNNRGYSRSNQSNSRYSRGNTSSILYSQHGSVRKLATASLQNSIHQDFELDVEKLDKKKLISDDQNLLKMILLYAQHVHRNLDFVFKVTKMFLKKHFGDVLSQLLADSLLTSAAFGQSGGIAFKQRARVRAL